MWVAPTTRATGYLVSASNWNQDVVNNSKYLAKPPSCRIQKSTEQSITNAASRSVSWNTEIWDTDNMWSSTAPTRIDINTNGKYEVTAYAVFANSSAGTQRFMGITVDGTTTADGNYAKQNKRPIVGDKTFINLTDVISLTSTQFLRVQVYQDSGGALNLDHSTGANASISSCTVRWISS